MNLPTSSHSIHRIDDDSIIVLGRIANGPGDPATERIILDERMTPNRAREFRAGRHIARMAIIELEKKAPDIPIGENGEPIWPKGLCGSLAHTHLHVAAFVSRCSRIASLGIDLDDNRHIGDAASAELMVHSEIAAVLKCGWAHDIQQAQDVAFCLKEAIFKCQYPVSGDSQLEFKQVKLLACPHGLALRGVGVNSKMATLLGSISLFSKELQGVMTYWAILPLPIQSV